MRRKYAAMKKRKQMREIMSVQEQKEMCRQYGGTWVPSYIKENVRVAGYCRYTKDTAYKRNRTEIFLKKYDLPFVQSSSKWAWDYRKNNFRWKRVGNQEVEWEEK